MRIVSGLYKGKKIDFPRGEQTRPTKDRIREAIFNILSHASWCEIDIEESHVIDVFAGSGSLGFEALSRGAIDCIFIDSDYEAENCCINNAESMHVSSKCKVIREDIRSIKYRPENIIKRNLVFLDPPYSQDLGINALKELYSRDWLDEEAIIVLEMSKKHPEHIDNEYILLEERNYGITKVCFLKHR